MAEEQIPPDGSNEFPEEDWVDIEGKKYPRKSPYEILGVSSTASHKELKHAFAIKARGYHSDTGNLGPAARNWMKLLNAAYAAVSDDQLKEAYDKTGWGGTPRYTGPEITEEDKKNSKINTEDYLKLAEEIAARNDMLNKFDPMARLEYQTHNPAFGIYHENMAGMWNRNSYSQYREYTKKKAEDLGKEKKDSGPVSSCNCASPIINYSKSGIQTCKRCGKPRNWTTKSAQPPQIGPIR